MNAFDLVAALAPSGVTLRYGPDKFRDSIIEAEARGETRALTSNDREIVAEFIAALWSDHRRFNAQAFVDRVCSELSAFPLTSEQGKQIQQALLTRVRP